MIYSALPSPRKRTGQRVKEGKKRSLSSWFWSDRWSLISRVERQSKFPSPLLSLLLLLKSILFTQLSPTFTLATCTAFYFVSRWPIPFEGRQFTCQNIISISTICNLFTLFTTAQVDQGTVGTVITQLCLWANFVTRFKRTFYCCSGVRGGERVFENRTRSLVWVE